jgi:hypothetical protein
MLALRTGRKLRNIDGGIRMRSHIGSAIAPTLSPFSMDNSLDKETHTALGRALLNAIRAVRAADAGGDAGDAPWLLDQVTNVIAGGVAPATEISWQVHRDFPFVGGDVGLNELGSTHAVVELRVMVREDGSRWLAFDIPRGRSHVERDAYLELRGVRVPVPTACTTCKVQR